MPVSRRFSLLICLVLGAATVAVYAPVRNHEFVDFDDGLYVRQNSLVQKGVTWEGIGEILRAPANGFWHPLTLLSHMLDCQLFGLRAGAHHLTNLLFHILNTLLLYLFFKAATGSIWRSAFVAALFALHPLHVESVAWVSDCVYVLKTFWPAGLAVHYPYAGMIPPWKILGALLILAALTAMFIRGIVRRPCLLVGWMWFLGTLVPVIGLIPIGSHAMADR